MLASPRLSEDTEALFARISVLEKKVENLKFIPSEAAPEKTEKKPSAKAKSEKAEEQKKPEQQKEEKDSDVAENVPQKNDDALPKPENSNGESEWRELQTLDSIAEHIQDMTTRYLLKEYAKAVYRGSEVVIITEKPGDVEELKKNIDKIRAAFVADHKEGRDIRIECGKDTVKYVGEMYAYNNVETNPMFNFQ